MTRKPPRCPIAIGDYLEVAGPHAGGRSCGVVIGMTETHLLMRRIRLEGPDDDTLTWKAHRRTALLGDLATEPEGVKAVVRRVRQMILAGCYDTVPSLSGSWAHTVESNGDGSYTHTFTAPER